jgi:hypothetical protein
MVRIKFVAHPRTLVISPRFAPMASEGSGDASTGRRGSSAEQSETSLADDQALASMEATSEQDVGFVEENSSRDTSDSGNVSDDGSHVKIGAEATVADVSYDFGRLTVTRASITSLKNFAHYFSKGFARLPDMESVLVLRKMTLLCSKISSLLVFAYLRARFFLIFYRNFRYSCIS